VVDIEKQVAYWRSGAEEDWLVGRDLISQNRVRHGLFFIHLALEKVLKAHVCRRIQDIAPRLHNLTRLAEIAGIELDQVQQNILADLSIFSIEGRYPDMLLPTPSVEQAQSVLEQATELFQWLMSQL
jgi:HEPN domain-containing protein